LIKKTAHNFSYKKLPVSHSDNGNYYLLNDFYKDEQTHELYVATSFADGLYGLNESTGTTKHYPLPAKFYTEEKTQRLDVMLVDRHKNFWFITPDYFLQFDRKTNT